MCFVKTFSLMFLFFITLVACGSSSSTSDQNGDSSAGDGSDTATATKQLVKGVLKNTSGNPIADALVFVPSSNKNQSIPAQFKADSSCATPTTSFCALACTDDTGVFAVDVTDCSVAPTKLYIEKDGQQKIVALSCNSTEECIVPEGDLIWSSGGGGVTSKYKPSCIVASWSGGAVGNPTDRTDTKATNWTGSMCHPEYVELKNYIDGEVLNVINNCDRTNVFYICAANGSPAQPENGLKECEEDPLDTSMDYLKLETLTSGGPGDFIKSTKELSINIFYCSDDQELVGPPDYSAPLRCL